MHYSKSIAFFALLVLFYSLSVNGQNRDSAFKNSSASRLSNLHVPIKNLSNKMAAFKSYIVPEFFIAYGFYAIENDQFKNFNLELKDEVYAENPHARFKFDNYLQFAPAAMVYGLDAIGIKARHNLRDRTMLFLMSTMITSGSVFAIKNLSQQLRPDGSDYLSFPSGHTAEAFASAEFMRQEYKDISPWYGLAGYAASAATGYLRMFNNKHWVSDVIAGAGVGIASTKLAYWLYPKIQHKYFRDKPINTIVMPSFKNGSFGFGLVHRF